MKKGELYTEEVVLTKVEAAFIKWQGLPEKERGKFNSNWFLKSVAISEKEIKDKKISPVSKDAKSAIKWLRS